jgi:hypothetical protein
LPNGTLGDDPILDITLHHARVFSPTADRLVRQLLIMMTSQEVEALRVELRHVPPTDPAAVAFLEDRLSGLKEALILRATQSGWDLDLLHSRLSEQP